MRAAAVLLVVVLVNASEDLLVEKRSSDGDLVQIRNRRQTSSDLTCANNNITASLRKLFLKAHNTMRQAIARGQEGGMKGLLPPARNMYKLKWSCDLETQAQKWASSCATLEADHIESQGQNFVYVPNVAAGSDPTKAIVDTLIAWRSQIQTAAIEGDLRFNAALDIANWANMAHDDNTKLGCAYSYCSGQLAVNCFYDSAGDLPDQVVYQIGEPCSADFECVTYSGSHCVPAASMCYHPDTTEVTSSNTICPRNVRMSDAARVAVLDFHNAHRSSLARGLQQNAAGGMAPQARNMMKMQYDCALERSAAAAVEECLYETGARGENLYMTDLIDSENDQVALLQKAASSWWSELHLLGINSNITFAPNYFFKNMNHFTQMAWSSTDRIGCATKVCGEKFLVACHYSPAGNRFKKPIYEQGSPCLSDTSCDMGQECIVEDSLCSIVSN